MEHFNSPEPTKVSESTPKPPGYDRSDQIPGLNQTNQEEATNNLLAEVQNTSPGHLRRILQGKDEGRKESDVELMVKAIPAPGSGNSLEQEHGLAPGESTHTVWNPKTNKPQSTDINMKGLGTGHVEFDEDGQPKSLSFKGKDGSTLLELLDKNGNTKSIDTKSKEGTEAHISFEPTSGNVKTADVKHTDGSSEHVDYETNSKSGKMKGAVVKFNDGTVERDNYDSKENLVSATIQYPDGAAETAKFDPQTGAPTSIDAKRNNK